ncbi:M12 family metallopeptidase [Pseudomonas sp. GD03842]|uniref:M12 family metallopeptidase n=1 Tax=Pseudomonas sp. GD03842 TaxID=2975385 RepID=UPI00244C6F3F|nr:M12 family metallopeptidase [Pseudomonas sp. GD03842]MDH0747522.1 M12 family metallopeptidase [Pseudomonas sp. GD03842]
MYTPPITNTAQIAARQFLNASSSGRRKRSIGYRSAFWPNGSTLKIGFVDEALSEDHKQHIIDAINQWQPYVNLTFEFIDGREDQPGDGKGDIRITTESSMNYSLIGTGAKANDPWTPTMVLGIKPSDPKFASTVMHEFGHALGAEHEHQHPEAEIPWDLPKVYAFYASKGHDAEAVDESVLSRLPSEAALTLPYDRHSIMHYPIDNALTIGDWEVGVNSTLSEKDKSFMRLAYPRD